MREAESRESERGRGQTEQWRLETRERRRAETREKGKTFEFFNMVSCLFVCLFDCPVERVLYHFLFNHFVEVPNKWNFRSFLCFFAF